MSKAIRSNGNGLATLTCPLCTGEFPLTDAITAKLTSAAEALTEQRVQDAAERAKQNAIAEAKREQEELTTRLEQAEFQMTEMRKRESALAVKERELSAAAELQEAELQRRLVQESERIRSAEERRLRSGFERSAQEAAEELTIVRRRLQESELAEAALRAQRTELQERERAIDIEVGRRVDEARKQLSDQIRVAAQEQAQLELERKDLEISRLQSQIAKLKETSADRSQEVSGEALERLVISALREMFKLDDFEEIPRGEHGADIRHVIRDAGLAHRGKVIIEVKNAQTWSKGWLSKVKQAQQSEDADACIIISRVLPTGMQHMGQIDGVWVADVATAGPLVLALRSGILQVSAVRAAAESEGSRLDGLRQLLTSNRFRLQVETIVRSIQAMEEQLSSERKAVSRMWERRSVCIGQMGQTLGQVIGALEGAMQRDLVSCASLELSSDEEVEVGNGTA